MQVCFTTTEKQKGQRKTQMKIICEITVRHSLLWEGQDFGYIFPQETLAKWMSIPTLEGIMNSAGKSPLFWFPCQEQLKLDKSTRGTVRADFRVTLGDPPVEFIAVENVFYPVIFLEDILSPAENATNEDREWINSDAGKQMLVCFHQSPTAFTGTVLEQIQRVQKGVLESINFWVNVWKKEGFQGTHELLADGLGE